MNGELESRSSFHYYAVVRSSNPTKVPQHETNLKRSSNDRPALYTIVPKGATLSLENRNEWAGQARGHRPWRVFACGTVEPELSAHWGTGHQKADRRRRSGRLRSQILCRCLCRNPAIPNSAGSYRAGHSGTLKWTDPKSETCWLATLMQEQETMGSLSFAFHSLFEVQSIL